MPPHDAFGPDKVKRFIHVSKRTRRGWHTYRWILFVAIIPIALIVAAFFFMRRRRQARVSMMPRQQPPPPPQPFYNTYKYGNGPTDPFAGPPTGPPPSQRDLRGMSSPILSLANAQRNASDGTAGVLKPPNFSLEAKQSPASKQSSDMSTSTSTDASANEKLSPKGKAKEKPSPKEDTTAPPPAHYRQSSGRFCVFGDSAKS